MKSRLLFLFCPLLFSCLIKAAPLVEVIETTSPPDQMAKGASANAAYLVRSRAKTPLHNVVISGEGMTVLENNCPTTMETNTLCQVSTRVDATTGGSHKLLLLVDANNGKYVFSSPDRTLEVVEEQPTSPGDKEAILYYKRPDGDYAGWGLHLWNDNGAVCQGVSSIETDWAAPLEPESITVSFGAMYRIPLTQNSGCLNFIMHKGEEKNLSGGNMLWEFGNDERLSYTYSGYNVISATPLIEPPLVVDGAKAHWVASNTLIWNEGAGIDVDRAEIVYSEDASVTLGKAGLAGTFKKIPLTAGGTVSTSVKNKFPHLMDRSVLSLSETTETIKAALKGQLLAVAYSNDKPKYVTHIQTPGILDELYKYGGALGAIVGGSGVMFKLWAPTAKDVKLLFKNTSITPPDMTFDDNTGV